MHDRTRRRLAPPLAAAVTLGVAVGAPPGASADPGVATAPAAATHTVTLITGDRVQLRDGATTGTITPGPGRGRMSFRTSYQDGHVSVVPHDALRLVATGRVDRRLFDVTALVAFGYDDAHTDAMPLIVAGSSPSLAAKAGTGRRLRAVPATALRVRKREAVSAWRSLVGGQRLTAGVTKVWLDGKRALTLDRSVKQVGAPAAWQAGYTGAGVKVAVLDTGVDTTHPDLAGRIIAAKDFTGSPENIDDVGHGTHVAATIASTGARAGGKYRGVAPGASLLNGKVCLLDGCPDSAILDGMAWAAEQGARVVNMSLGGRDTPETDPLEAAVDALSAKHGTLFVISAGNSGPKPRTLGSPGTAGAALTVGAVDRDDSLAQFSSRGPRLADGGIKPDITAPGVEIVAAKSAAGVLGRPVEDGYVAMSGTSMAAPHVAGAAALLAQQHPTWTGPQLKAALVASAEPNPALTIFEQGSGRLDVAEAITQPVSTEPTSLSLGVQLWPHADDRPLNRSITYRNSGTADLTLTLSVRADGPDGKPATPGMFAINPATITVPAGGEVTSTVTVDTRLGSVDGSYSGAVTASGAGHRVVTPLAVVREVESYDVTVTHLDRAGAPAADYLSVLASLDEDWDWPLYNPAGNVVTVRVPKGRYLVDGSVYMTDDKGETLGTLLTQPLLTVAGKTSVALDARLAKPVRITSPDAGATPLVGQIVFSRRWGRDSSYNSGETTFGRVLPDTWSAQLGPAVPAKELSTLVSGVWSRPGPSSEPAVRPVLYGLGWSQLGRAYTGFSGAIDKRRLARVTLQPAPAPKDRFAYLGLEAWGKLDTEGFGALIKVAASEPTTLYLSGASAQWSTRFEHYKTGSEEDPNAEVWYASPAKHYRAGGRFTERVGFAVSGPVLPKDPQGWLLRKGNEIGAGVPLFGDAAGNAGWSKVRTGRARLWRDGKLIKDVPAYRGLFAVPPTRGTYRLAVEAQRDGSDVSTSVSAAWTFRSAAAADDRVVRLPASVVRFTPPLDGDNAAPAGREYRVPVAVQTHGPVGTVRLLSVEYSTDDGRTWRTARVAGGVAVVNHPGDAGFVSLRATASDDRGNRVEQTIVRAYKLVLR